MKGISFPILREGKTLTGKVILYLFSALLGINFILQVEKVPFGDTFLIISLALIIGTYVILDLISLYNRHQILHFDSSVQLTGTDIKIQLLEAVEDYFLTELNSVTFSINESRFDPYLKGLFN